MRKQTFKNKINTFILLLINKIQNPIVELFCRNSISIIAYANKICNYTLRNNLGDDLNFDYIETAFNVKCFKYEYSIFKKKNKYTYSFIGSILEYVIETNPHTIVWGTGFKFKENEYTFDDLKYLDIRAVRGPRTRKLLLDKGVNCPNVFGDPAILLSRFYSPKKSVKRYKLGIIPHKDDSCNPLINRFLDNEDVVLLSLKGYKNWRSFIDDICSCDFIISTSLHGIIISDSYSIPNMWISVSDVIEGGDFKYYDYYEGVCKTPIKKYLGLEVSLDEILTWKSLWVKPIVSPLFVDSCPLKLRKCKKGDC